MKTNTIKIFQVDSFTAVPFRGNPAGVCLLSGPAEAGWMQSVAREMNLSETAFLYPLNDDYNLRWFTPAVEVDLCGHATLASAHILWETGALSPDASAHFQTRSGLLTCSRQGDLISMDFPATPPSQVATLPGLADALGVHALSMAASKYDYLVEVESEAVVRALSPDFTALAKLPARGVIVTAPSSDPQFDIVSRFFAPAVGINEDPVTGSAHCCLAPFWCKRLGKTELSAYQASPRGGILSLRLAGERVFISGQAVTILRGELV